MDAANLIYFTRLQLTIQSTEAKLENDQPFNGRFYDYPPTLLNFNNFRLLLRVFTKQNGAAIRNDLQVASNKSWHGENLILKLFKFHMLNR